MKSEVSMMPLALLCLLQACNAQKQEMPLIGIINYDALKGGVQGQSDVNSMSPPKYQNRLPFYANVYDDDSRLVRTRASLEEFIYYIPESDIMGFKIETAFDTSDILQSDYELQIFTSRDNIHYDLYRARVHDIGQDWRKVDYWAYSLSRWSERIPKGTKYLKIRFNRTDNKIESPQIMRVEINYGEQGKKLFVDEMDDFSKMFAHTNNLAFASDNPDKFNVVTANSYSQEIMDQEIKYAGYAGIDYMAFINCPNGYSLNWGVDLLLNGNGRLNFCFIIHHHHSELETWDKRIERYVRYFKENRYQKVMDGRPLVYVFDSRLFSDEDFERLRVATVQAGLKEPYIVTMNGDRVMDAVSKYGSSMPGFDRRFWEAEKEKGNKVIPNISLGANAVCRHDNPPPWGSVSWAEPIPQPEEMVKYVEEGLEWVRKNPDVAEANTILIYSWNEFAEGGSMCPSLGKGIEIIDAFHAFFKNYR